MSRGAATLSSLRLVRRLTGRQLSRAAYSTAFHHQPPRRRWQRDRSSRAANSFPCGQHTPVSTHPNGCARRRYIRLWSSCPALGSAGGQSEWPVVVGAMVSARLVDRATFETNRPPVRAGVRKVPRAGCGEAEALLSCRRPPKCTGGWRIGRCRASSYSTRADR
jgi:hypothetical protein